MILDLSNLAIYLRPGHCDMRKAINGLSIIVEETMAKDLLSGIDFFAAHRELSYSSVR